MTHLTIRKSGGTNIVSLPKAVLNALDLHTNSVLSLSLKGNQIVLTPLSEEMTLDELLAGSPKARLAIREEDREWVNDKPVGREEF